MESVASSDGTRIAFDVRGSGPPLVIVHGTTGNSTTWGPEIRPELERQFTVFAMDRRGRGGSGDGDDYSLQREVDDVVAVVRRAGTEVDLLGHSFGALCALEASLRLDNLRRVVLYEPPFPPAGGRIFPEGLRRRLSEKLESGDRDGTLEGFLRAAAGVDDEGIAQRRADPSWATRIAMAHTVVREMGAEDYAFEAEKFGRLRVPFLLIIGENSPDYLVAASRRVEAAIPTSRVTVLAGQGHVATTSAPKLFLDSVIGFLAER